MSAASPLPGEAMSVAEGEQRYPPAGVPNDSAGDVRMHDDGERGPVKNVMLDDVNAPSMERASPDDLPPPPGGLSTSGPPPSKPVPYRERNNMAKPNKVYIGGLPEHTREEDLQSCFGKIGHIVSIELKLGYGFVEFEDREAAEESVAKYNDGHFMGNKIRVEISKGGSRALKPPGEPGACFKCGQMGHWARECPNSTVGPAYHSQPRVYDNRRPPDTGVVGRMSHGSRDVPPSPRDRDYSAPRGEQASSKYQDNRYSYDYAPRDQRPPSPTRDSRDYYGTQGGPPRSAVPPPQARPAREYDDYRRDYRAPPPSAPPPQRTRPYYESDYDRDPGYSRPSYNGPPPNSRDSYDRGYDRGAPERYAPYPAQRPRTPPGPPPPRGRDGYDRAAPPPRDYVPPPQDYRQPADYRRPASPPPAPAPRYSEYSGGRDSAPRYRSSRRSQSPPPRSASGTYRGAHYPPEPPVAEPPSNYAPAPERAPYGGPAYPSNGYAAPPVAAPPAGPPRSAVSHAGSGSGRPRPDDREYHAPPRPVDRIPSRENVDPAAYARRA